MDTLTYSKDQIEKLLNIINTLPYQGFQNASKLCEIFSILNNPIKEKDNQNLDTKSQETNTL